MISFKTFLVEKRKNPEQNSKIHYYDLFEKYGSDPSIYITFTTEEKVGINPHSQNTTPNGIYVYPLKTLMDTNPDYNKALRVINIDKIVKNAPFIYILKAKCDMTDVKKYSMANYKSDLQKLKKLQKSGYLLKGWTDKEYNDLILASQGETNDSYGVSSEREKVPFRMMINTLNFIAYLKDPPQIVKTKKLNLGKGVIKYHNVQAQKVANYLRKLGYCGFVDHGHGLIHGQEFIQGFFLSKSGFSVIDKINNKKPPVKFMDSWKEFEEYKDINKSGYDWVKSQLIDDPKDDNYLIYKDAYSVFRFKKAEKP